MGIGRSVVAVVGRPVVVVAATAIARLAYPILSLVLTVLLLFFLYCRLTRHSNALVHFFLVGRHR